MGRNGSVVMIDIISAAEETVESTIAVTIMAGGDVFLWILGLC